MEGMSLVWIIYWIDWLGEGNPFPSGGTLFGYTLLFLFVYVVCTVAYGITNELDPGEAFSAVGLKVLKLKCWYITFAVVCFLGSIGNSLLPTKDTAYKMLAAYGVTELVKSEDVRRLGSKSLEVLEKAMNSYIEESTPDT